MLSHFCLLTCTATPPESSFSGSGGPGRAWSEAEDGSWSRASVHGEVRTRMGAYPFPESIVIPSYSTAKIAFAAVAPGRQYKAGLWAYSVDPDTWISQMLGYGGIIVDMLPGSATYYYVSDGGQFYNDEDQFASTLAVIELQQL